MTEAPVFVQGVVILLLFATAIVVPLLIVSVIKDYRQRKQIINEIKKYAREIYPKKTT